jgi:hypothetical protein
MPNAAAALVVPFTGSLPVIVLDQAFVNCAAEPDQMLVIDLRGVTYIEPVALLYLLSVLAARLKLADNTRLRLPTSHRVRDFLRAWSFPAAVRITTGVPFARLADEDLHYFGEAQRYYLVAPDADGATGDVLAHLESRRFFGLMPYRIHVNTDATRALEDEWSRWRTPLILQVLARFIRGPQEDVARVLIYELLANAIQHPEATTATVVSSIGRRRVNAGTDDTHFTLAVWDDGKSITDTLRQCLTEIGTVRVANARVDDTFDVRASGWTSAFASLRASWTPPRDTSDEELLLSSLFSGISQKVASVSLPTASLSLPHGDWPEVSQASDAGNGLSSLYKSVVDDFRGTLSIRTGRSFLHLKRHKGSPSYSVKIVRYDDSHPLHGNFVTVRIPLHN